MTGMPAEVLLARAALWRWAAHAFWYPEAGFLASLRDPGLRAGLANAAAGGGDPPEADAIARALGGIWAAADGLDPAGPGLAEEHTFLFARQVTVPAHETSYLPASGSDYAARLADLGGFYAAFGLNVSATRPERPDHVSVELEFAAALLAKEAYAVARGWHEHADVARSARGRFVREHPASWLPSFATRLAGHARLAFYPAVAGLVLALLALEPAAAHAATASAGDAARGAER